MGGVNLICGTFGLILFRCTNRYSIFILYLSLIFLAKTLSKISNKVLLYLLSVILLGCGLYDQVPPHVMSSCQKKELIAKQIIDDKKFVRTLEHNLPKNTLIFQLPVDAYPSLTAIEKMEVYEQLKLYLYSKSLIYSYGALIGSYEYIWQIIMERLPIKEMLNLLKYNNFRCVCINKKGYKDRGKNIISSIEALGGIIIAQNRNFVCIDIYSCSQQNGSLFRITFPAASLFSKVGQVIDKSRIAKEGRDKAGWLIYGPYIPLKKGRYKLSLTYFTNSTMRGLKTGRWDIYFYKKKKVLKKGFIIATGDINQRNIVVSISITNELENVPLEFRVFYLGKGDLKIKKLTIEKIS